jgi:hypothetical protein
MTAEQASKNKPTEQKTSCDSWNRKSKELAITKAKKKTRQAQTRHDAWKKLPSIGSVQRRGGENFYLI